MTGRPRGRPRKQPLVGAGGEAALPDSQVASAPRRRGRPKKQAPAEGQVAPQDPEQPVRRRPGRPRKYPLAAAQPTPIPQAPGGALPDLAEGTPQGPAPRRRGRPRKRPLPAEQSGPDLQAPASLPPVRLAQDAPQNLAPRRRGRPRKYPLPADQATPDPQAPAGSRLRAGALRPALRNLSEGIPQSTSSRPRGRPKKSTGGASGVDNGDSSAQPGPALLPLNPNPAVNTSPNLNGASSPAAPPARRRGRPPKIRAADSTAEPGVLAPGHGHSAEEHAAAAANTAAVAANTASDEDMAQSDLLALLQDTQPAPEAEAEAETEPEPFPFPFPKPSTLADLAGTYEVDCPGIINSSNSAHSSRMWWALMKKTLTIVNSSSGPAPDTSEGEGEGDTLVAASFDLGVIHGTMRLALSEQAVRAFVRAQEVREERREQIARRAGDGGMMSGRAVVNSRDASGRVDHPENGHDNGQESRVEMDVGGDGGGFDSLENEHDNQQQDRQAGTESDGNGADATGGGASSDAITPPQKRKAPSQPHEPSSQAATKRQKKNGIELSGGETDRVYFAFRCGNSLSGAIHPDTQSGYLDFSTDEQSGVTSFRGVADFPVLGDGVELVGRRIGRPTMGSAPRWEEYSGLV